jgi:hypothetical protein
MHFRLPFSRGIFRPETIKVESIGDLVVMHFGNTEVKLKYEAALKFAQMVRVQGKVAKRRAGDVSRHWSCVGVLSDAEKLAAGRF